MKQYTFKLDSQHTLYMVADPAQRHYVHSARLWCGQESFVDLICRFRDSSFEPPEISGLYLAVRETAPHWTEHYSMVYYDAGTWTWYKKHGRGWRVISRGEIIAEDYYWTGLTDGEARAMNLNKVTP